jgi:hypothetical protein
MTLAVPAPLRIEHEELHTALRQGLRWEDATGEAARRVERLLAPHVAKEEELVMPALGFLPALAGGNLSLDMPMVIVVAEKLKTQLEDLLAEHRAIVASLELLMDAASREQHPDMVEFAQRKMLHLQIEEQVYYPMAMVVGDYVRIRFGR